jgi:hypothetical protein
VGVAHLPLGLHDSEPELQFQQHDETEQSQQHQEHEVAGRKDRRILYQLTNCSLYLKEAMIATLNAQLKKKLTLYAQDKLHFEITTLNQLRDKFNELTEK